MYTVFSLFVGVIYHPATLTDSTFFIKKILYEIHCGIMYLEVIGYIVLLRIVRASSVS